jgi:hypothetical protein
MLFWLAALGAICWIWDWAGLKYALPHVQTLIADPEISGWMRNFLSNFAVASLSSLNFLSCVSIYFIAQTMRSLIRQGHLEQLTLVPGTFRPATFFYAMSSRFAPLALIAVIVLYLSDESPFHSPPFDYSASAGVSAQEIERHMSTAWTLGWAGLRELGVVLFCFSNLFVDLAAAFWIFCVWRVSFAAMLTSIVAVGLGSPILIAWFYAWICEFVRGRLIEADGVFGWIIEPYEGILPFYTEQDIQWFSHYLAMSALSAGLAFFLLFLVNWRWWRIVRSPKKDPIFLKMPR